MQREGNFVPGVYTRPKPPGFSAVVSAVMALFAAPAPGGTPTHRFARQPEPGPGAWALLPTSPGLPFSIAAGGYIVANNGASQVLSGPQVMWGQATGISGFNGTVYGGTYQQGLIDMAAYMGAEENGG